MRRARTIAARAAAVALLAALVRPTAADAALATPGFRAVGVAHSLNPISAMAAAPDGRLFVAVQTTAQTAAGVDGTTEIRVYTDYATSDGALLDEGISWATLAGVRSTSTEEGLLSLALAPDFATSKLVYVYLATNDESANQHVRVYRENAGGTGDYLGTVQTTLEPATESSTRNGGAMAFGVDGCLYVGVGDNNSRWNAQLLSGTTTIGGTEAGALCTAVCLGGAELPERTVTNDGLPNRAGKMLRLAVEGDSPAQPAPGGTLSAQPAAFSVGMRNPLAAAVHPLTGQLYVSERGESQRSEISVLDAGSNQGWPCLEGDVLASTNVAACLAGHTMDEVRAAHPAWRQPIVTHTGNPAPNVTGLTAYTGFAYPADYFGDVFYLIRDSARIYRIDLQPPCFLPNPGGVATFAFHDTNSDGDFSVTGDFNGDHAFENVSFNNFTAIATGPDRFGQQVLYVAGKQGNGFSDDAVVFRIEYATDFVPYSGPTGRVADACFTDGTYSGTALATVGYDYENPFLRPTCMPVGGPCPGQPDGTACGDSDPCNGVETCQGGICQHGTVPDDGTTPCGESSACRDLGICTGGVCATGPAKANGTSCTDGDPCNGAEVCQDGTCQAGAGPQALSLRTLVLKKSGGALTLGAGFAPTGPLAPATTDAVTLRLASTEAPVDITLEHPDSDSGWRPTRNGFRYADRRHALTPITAFFGKPRGANTQVTAQARGLTLPSASGAYTRAQLLIGEQCFSADVTCTVDARKVRCR